MKKRDLGIEIEFKQSVHFTIEKAKELIKNFNKNISDYEYNNWQTKIDESCGFEIVSPILNSNNFENDLYQIISFINYHYSKFNIINQNCGLHIHVDISDYSVINLINLVTLTKMIERPLIYKFVDKTRQNNRYCKSIDYEKQIRQYNNKNISDFGKKIELKTNKYYGLNIKSLSTKRTLEFRYHESTLNYNKIKIWIIFILSLIEYCNESNSRFPFIEGITPNNILYLLGMNKKDIKEFMAHMR